MPYFLYDIDIYFCMYICIHTYMYIDYFYPYSSVFLLLYPCFKQNKQYFIK